MFYILQSYFIVLLETLCCTIFFDIFCNTDEKQSRIRRVGVIVLLSLFMFVIAVVFSANLGLKEVVLILLVTFVMKYYNGKSFKKNIVLMIIYQSIVLVVDYVAVVLAVDYILGVDMTSYFVQSLLVVLAKLFLFLVIMLIRTLFAKKDMKHFSDEIWLKFLFFPMFTLCIIVALLSNSFFMLEKQQQELYWIIAFGLVGMNIVVFYLVNDVALTQKKIHEKEMFEVQATTQMQLYETISEKVQQQRAVSHEYKNQITCIQSLCEKEEYDELKKYLKQISGEILHDLDYIDTNNIIVNAVINVK